MFSDSDLQQKFWRETSTDLISLYLAYFQPIREKWGVLPSFSGACVQYFVRDTKTSPRFRYKDSWKAVDNTTYFQILFFCNRIVRFLIHSLGTSWDSYDQQSANSCFFTERQPNRFIETRNLSSFTQARKYCRKLDLFFSTPKNDVRCSMK